MFANEYHTNVNLFASARLTNLMIWAGLGKRRFALWTFAAVALAMAAGASAQPNGGCAPNAISIKVDCDKNQTINAALACAAYSSRPVSLDIYGTCKENIVIQNSDRITLTGHNGASIVDQSNGTSATVEVSFSSLITVQDLIITGGSQGFDCGDMSTCRLQNSTVQNAAGPGVQIRSRSAVEDTNNTIQNNGGRGISVYNGSTLISLGDTVTGSGASGVAVEGASMVASSSTFKSSAGNGLRADNNAAVRLQDVVISNNGANGISLESGATIQWFDNVGSIITANSGNGMILGDQVNSQFSGLDTVKGNLTQPDVNCVGLYWIASNVNTIGGTTNCLEPAHKYSDNERGSGESVPGAPSREKLF